jgi:hypothetical protein
MEATEDKSNIKSNTRITALFTQRKLATTVNKERNVVKGRKIQTLDPRERT